jgi:S1-C subfamily serine protease
MMMFDMTGLISKLKNFIKRILNKRIFFIIFLIAIVACFDQEKPISAAVTSGPLDLSTVVAAEQLGKAFTAIASHVKPAVVSVFSEKKVKLQQWGIPFPFSDELLRQFFGGRLPRQKSPDLPREYTIPQMGMGSDGKPVDDAGALRNLVAGSAPGTRIKIEYLRNGKKQSTTVTIGEQKNETKNEQFGVEKNGTSSEQFLEQPLEQLGLSIEALNKDMALMYNIKEKSGVMITDIQYGSPADVANLRVGDVITQINRKPIKSTDDIVKILAQSKSDTILMLVKRQEMSLFISLKKN